MDRKISGYRKPPAVGDPRPDPGSVEFAPWPSYSEAEIDLVSGVLRSGRVNYWTGELGRRFEAQFASYCGTRHAVALANGSLALEAALRGLGIGPGDEVIVTPRSFVASASCVVLCGAKPVFADVDPDSQNMTAHSIENAITDRTKALIAVHLAGWPCEMDAIIALAERTGIKIIEDCAQAHGARFRGQSIGSFGDVAAFSFCQDKIITTAGEGGMIVTNDETLWSTIWSFKDHGKNYHSMHDRHRASQGSGFRWVHDDIGTNWRMTEIQSAVGLHQLEALPQWIERRRQLAALLTDCFAELPALRVTRPGNHITHAYYKYYAFVRPERLRSGWDRDRIMAAVTAAGVPCYSGSCAEIYLEKAFTQRQLEPPQRLPIAQQLGQTSLMFLVHPTLSDAAIEATCDTVTQIVTEASR